MAKNLTSTFSSSNFRLKFETTPAIILELLSLEKIDKAIRELSLTEQKINFNSVSQLSGVSKTFLYNNEDIKKRIEELRDKQTSKTMNQRAKYHKTAKAKDKKIKELEEEIKRLKEHLEILGEKLYEHL